MLWDQFWFQNAMPSMNLNSLVTWGLSESQESSRPTNKSSPSSWKDKLTAMLPNSPPLTFGVSFCVGPPCTLRSYFMISYCSWIPQQPGNLWRIEIYSAHGSEDQEVQYQDAGIWWGAFCCVVTQWWDRVRVLAQTSLFYKATNVTIGATLSWLYLILINFQRPRLPIPLTRL
jgi:hypothetical protein